MDLNKLKLEQFERICVINKPDKLLLEIDIVQDAYDCLIAFVQTRTHLSEAIDQVKSMGKEISLIIVYPKGSSKKYKAEVNRDIIINVIREDSRFKAPKLVSLDKDWSGFSFRYKTGS